MSHSISQTLKRSLTLLVLAGLALTSAASAVVEIGSLHPPEATPGSLDKADEPATTLILPSFEVDRGNPAGTTTLFAVRNVSGSQQTVEATYYDVLGNTLIEIGYVLDGEETLTVNLRDVPGLGEDPDGFARGFAVFQSAADMTGDFFFVDVDGAFATGERLITLGDLCNGQELRYLDFGSGTDLTVLVEFPQGPNDGINPPSFVVHVSEEDGGAIGFVPVYTDQIVVSMTSDDVAFGDFGTLLFAFTGGSGWVYGEYSADGLFSVGLNSVCRNLVI